ncbi:CLUMA_CG015615, isoform A [Clunio marinus]|uniref:CLUMA_CG015615, isoform A n=1 Tax=Clunio marinus TaxID=568069 RepID=A0A1J1IS07_9DIPT|nr:CLUMA_CG015615, isoform A [Clunio marinus]
MVPTLTQVIFNVSGYFKRNDMKRIWYGIKKLQELQQDCECNKNEMKFFMRIIFVLASRFIRICLTEEYVTFFFLVQPLVCLWKFQSVRTEEEELLLYIQQFNLEYHVGSIIDIRNSTMTEMISSIVNYFITMVQIFSVDPFKEAS